MTSLTKTSATAKKSIFWGVAASVLLLAFYLIVLTLANSFTHALEQFVLLWLWLTLLTMGFGFQVGLYAFIRSKVKEKNLMMTGQVAAAGGVTTGSMIACCAHHLVDVMALMGFSALFLLLAQYQLLFIVLGIVSNFIGIILMLEVIKNQSLADEASLLWRLAQINVRGLRNWSIAGGLAVLALTFIWINGTVPDNTATGEMSPPVTDVAPDKNGPSSLKQTNSEGNLSIDATLIDFSPNKPVRFELALNTHQGDLGFKVQDKAYLFDDMNNRFLPTNWSGGSGGHHMVGTLTFPAVNRQAKKLKLVLQDIYGINERIFEWNIQ